MVQTSAAKMSVSLQLLGGLDFTGSEPSASARARRRHPLLLLALVAAAAPKPTSRERIMAFLWPESDAERASNSLRQALHSLRRALGEDLFLPDTSGGIRLNQSLSVDLWVFRDALAGGAPADAVAVYRGPFLDGFQVGGAPEFSQWIEAERARIAGDYAAALEALAIEAKRASRHDEAVSWRRRQAAADPFSSRVALALLRELAASGDKSGALEYAAVHERVLRAHLDVEPDPAVTEFVATLRRPTPPGSRASAEYPAQVLLPTPIDRKSLVASNVHVPSAIHTQRRLTRDQARWLVAIVVASLVGFGALGAHLVQRSPTGDVIVLASGADAGSGRDPSTRLVACEGPICPDLSLPQDAFVVPTHVAYTPPAAGTHFIAPSPGATALPPPGYVCCSTAVFENEFSLPVDAVMATISITVVADNQAIVAVNGTEFGRHADPKEPGNHGGQPATFATTFLPDPSGTNRLRVTLWDGGGAAGLNYRALVTFERRPTDSVGAGK